jgi:hypothetical protein
MKVLISTSRQFSNTPTMKGYTGSGAITATNTNGLWALTRTSSSTFTYFSYNASAAPNAGNATLTSSGSPNKNYYIFARNNNGTADNQCADKLAIAFISDSLSSNLASHAAMDSFAGYIKTYLNSVGSLSVY